MSKNKTVMKLAAAAAIATSAFASGAQQIDQHALYVIKREYPSGVPGYLDWNSTNKTETLRRAAHLAQQPEIMQYGEDTVRLERKAAIAMGTSLIFGGLAIPLYCYRSKHKKWLRRKNQADEELATMGFPATEVKSFTLSNMLRRETREFRALEETANALACGFLYISTASYAKGFLHNDIFASTTPVVEYKHTPSGPVRMVLMEEEKKWVWYPASE
jgi:hypothetical protein